jgi:hypothetical protein
MATTTTIDLQVDRRYIQQHSYLAITNVFEALVELVTNADDRYQVVGGSGRIEIEVERRRNRPSILRVRDFADGMTLAVMREKLGRFGRRVSGLEKGEYVRGTNSRGAKDIAALGNVSFHSIAGDGCCHRCRITTRFQLELHEESPRATRQTRQRLGILSGTGTLVEVEVHPDHPIPLHDNFVDKAGSLVPLRDILQNEARSVIVRDVGRDRETRLEAPEFYGDLVCSQAIGVREYPEARAKLRIYRATNPFPREKSIFRKSGILVKSRHAIHEATLFDYEGDEYAYWFFGRLDCPYIDDLWNDYDDRLEKGLQPTKANPKPVLDPTRKSGLTKDHPFVEDLFRQANYHLGRLVADERKRAEQDRKKIESRATRKRLDSLEKLASKFISDHTIGEAETREPTDPVPSSQFRGRGYYLSPPYGKLLVGESRACALVVQPHVFPEIAEGDLVQIGCETDEIAADTDLAPVERHPRQPDLLIAQWTVTGRARTEATGISVRVGPIHEVVAFEIIASHAELYDHVTELAFARKRYTVIPDGSKKKLRLFAPIADFPEEIAVGLEFSAPGLRVHGSPRLVPRGTLGISEANVRLFSNRRLREGESIPFTLTASVDGQSAECQVVLEAPAGSGIRIRLEDVDFRNRRYRWKANILEIAARHKALARYLGPKEQDYPNQDERHVRVLIAEIVSEAVCARVLADMVETSPLDYDGADWDVYYGDFSKLMSDFLPIAHQVVVAE